MRKLNSIFQEIIKFVGIFLASFVWIRYFERHLRLAFIYSILFSAGLYAAIWLINRKIKQKKGLKKEEERRAENIFLSMTCEKQPVDVLFQMLSKTSKQVTKHKEYAAVNYEYEEEKTLFWFEKSFTPISTDKIFEICSKTRQENAKKIIILCKEKTQINLDNIAQTFKTNIVVLDQYETYEKIYKKYDFFPKISHEYAKEKGVSFKEFVAYSFNKKRTKAYLFSAFVLILSGVFVRATIYYCMMSSLLLLFALISWLNPYFNTKKELL